MHPEFAILTQVGNQIEINFKVLNIWVFIADLDKFGAKALPTDFPLVISFRRCAPMVHDVLSASLIYFHPHGPHPLALLGGVLMLDFIFSVTF